MREQNHSEFYAPPMEFRKEPVEFVMPEEQYHQAKSEFNEEASEQAKSVKKRSIRSMLKYALGTVATLAVVGTSFNSTNNIGEEIITDPGKEYSYYSKNTLSINDRSIVVIKEDGSICLYGEDYYGIDSICYTHWGNAQPVSIDVGEMAAVVVYDDGTVQGYGDCGAWINGADMTNDYTDIVDAVCARNTSILLKDDGTVISTSKYEDLFDKCETWQDIIDIEGYANSVVGLKKDGTVCYAGYYDYLSDEISNWREIVKIKCRYDTIVGVKADGTVLTAGEDSNDLFQEVSAWTDIVDVSISGDIFGLKSDGTVVTTGQGPQCEVSGWSDVVAIDSTYGTTVGLKADGTLLIAGGEDVGFTNPYTIDNAKSVDMVTFNHDKYTILCVNKDGTVSANNENEYYYRDWTSIKKVSGAFGLTDQGKVLVADLYSFDYDLPDCENIIDISGYGGSSCVALKNDGTVVCYGFSDDFDVSEVSSWNNISSVYNNGDVIVGVKTDGTVVLTAADDYYNYHKEIIKEWRDICSIAFESGQIIGLKNDGTICGAGYGSLFEECAQWNDIVKIAGGFNSHLVGLKSDGTVVAVGDNFANQCDVDIWTGIVDIDACEQASVGVRADGTIVAVGYNCDGLCNTSGVTNVRLPDGYGDFSINPKHTPIGSNNDLYITQDEDDILNDSETDQSQTAENDFYESSIEEDGLDLAESIEMSPSTEESYITPEQVGFVVLPTAVDLVQKNALPYDEIFEGNGDVTFVVKDSKLALYNVKTDDLLSDFVYDSACFFGLYSDYAYALRTIIAEEPNEYGYYDQTNVYDIISPDGTVVVSLNSAPSLSDDNKYYAYVEPYTEQDILDLFSGNFTPGKLVVKTIDGETIYTAEMVYTVSNISGGKLVYSQCNNDLSYFDIFPEREGEIESWNDESFYGYMNVGGSGGYISMDKTTLNCFDLNTMSNRDFTYEYYHTEHGSTLNTKGFWLKGNHLLVGGGISFGYHDFNLDTNIGTTIEANRLSFLFGYPNGLRYSVFDNDILTGIDDVGNTLFSGATNLSYYMSDYSLITIGNSTFVIDKTLSIISDPVDATEGIVCCGDTYWIKSNGVYYRYEINQLINN